MSGGKLKLKVCGMRDPANILDVAGLNPDFMGFNFYTKSKRYVGDDFVIPDQFPTAINRVGVFVNDGVENILQLVAKHRLDFVQLHGDETVETCKALREVTKVIKVFRVGDNFDFVQTKPYIASSDFFLFDTKTDEYGGSGKAFDWELLQQYDQSVPFFLAGGLSLDNIAQVKELNNLNLYALDVNSGAEIQPGLKDAKILNTIFQLLNSSKNEIHS